MKRTWLIGLVVLELLIVALVVAVVVIRGPDLKSVDTSPPEQRPRFGPDESWPIGQTHLGWTRKSLVELLGEPVREGPWPIADPGAEWFEKYKEYQTLEWEWKSGKFMATLSPVDGTWICVLSYWVPHGWIN